jgi:transposase
MLAHAANIRPIPKGTPWPQPIAQPGTYTSGSTRSWLPGMPRLGLQRAQGHWRVLDDDIAWCDQQVRRHVRQDPVANRAAQLHGVGELTASALVAAVADMHQFDSARQFSAWLGLVPSQNSSGGKQRLGRITKRGDAYLRTLLIQGAKSALLAASKSTASRSGWCSCASA